MRLTSATDPAAVLAHLEAGAPGLRTSEIRADRLQRDARIRTGRWDLAVQLETGHPPATIEQGEDGLIVILSGDPVAQPVTNYADGEWGLLVQRVRLLHELTHLEYTDFADVKSRLDDLEQGHRPVAATLWNAFEDAAIEAAIRDRWPNFGDWFRQVRRNLLYASGPGIPDPAGGLVYPLAQAAVLAVMDGTVLEPGPLERLLDPTETGHHFYTDADRERFEATIVPAIRETKRALNGETESTDRNRLIMECFEAVLPTVLEADADGRAQVAAWGDTHWGMPDDASHDIESVPGKPLPAVDIEQSGAGPIDHPEAESTKTPSTDPEQETQQGDTERPADPDTNHTDEATATELAEDLSAEIEAKRRQGDGFEERSETIETLQAAISATETDLESDGVVLPEDEPTPHAPTQAAAEADGTRLARVLRNRFQKERKRSIKRNQRRGRLDPTALHRTATGARRVKQRRERPAESEHHCLFVLDRSGSMRKHVRVAEQAMGMLAVALEAVDVEVSVLELLDKEVRLAKPADRAVDRAAGRLYHGAVGGGTPLTDTLHIAREYLKRTSGDRFVIVVTDGRPSEPDRYREALKRFTVPVLGVNLTTEEAAGESEFHRQVTVSPETESLRRALRQLVQEVLFE